MFSRPTFSLVAALLAGCTTPLMHGALAMQAPSGSAVANPQIWPAAKSPEAITDQQTEATIAALLARMTIEQKIGQMIQADISAITPADLQRYPLGLHSRRRQFRPLWQ